MSDWGIRVKNADGRTILTTEDDFSTLINGASGAVTGTTFNYPTNTSSADLFLYRIKDLEAVIKAHNKGKFGLEKKSSIVFLDNIN